MSLGQIAALTALVLLAGFLLAVFLYGRKSGKESEQVDRLKDEVDAVRIAREAEAGVAKLSDAAVAERLRDKYMRR